MNSFGRTSGQKCAPETIPTASFNSWKQAELPTTRRGWSKALFDIGDVNLLLFDTSSSWHHPLMMGAETSSSTTSTWLSSSTTRSDGKRICWRSCCSILWGQGWTVGSFTQLCEILGNNSSKRARCLECQAAPLSSHSWTSNQQEPHPPLWRCRLARMETWNGSSVSMRCLWGHQTWRLQLRQCASCCDPWDLQGVAGHRLWCQRMAGT